MVTKKIAGIILITVALSVVRDELLSFYPFILRINEPIKRQHSKL